MTVADLADIEISLKLQASAVHAILIALGHRPHNEVAHLIAALLAQSVPQVQEANLKAHPAEAEPAGSLESRTH